MKPKNIMLLSTILFFTTSALPGMLFASLHVNQEEGVPVGDDENVTKESASITGDDQQRHERMGIGGIVACIFLIATPFLSLFIFIIALERHQMRGPGWQGVELRRFFRSAGL